MSSLIQPALAEIGGSNNSSWMDTVSKFFGEKGAGHFLTTDAFSNVLKAGVDLSSLYQSHKLFNMQSKMAKEEWKMNKDIFQREKQQEDWRHQLEF